MLPAVPRPGRRGAELAAAGGGYAPGGAELAAAGGVCGTSWWRPSGSTTTCCTRSAGTRAGQYTPNSLAEVGGVVVWNPA